MEIWIKSAKFNMSQGLVDHARLILAKDRVFDLDILEIGEQVNSEKYIKRE